MNVQAMVHCETEVHLVSEDSARTWTDRMNVIVAALDTEVREQFWFIDCGNERTLPLSVLLKCELNY